MQIESVYCGLCIDIGCDEDCYDYSFYKPDLSEEEFVKGIVNKKYDDDFQVEAFFAGFYNLLQEDSRIKYSDR